MSDEESCTNPSGDNNGCRQHTGVGFYKAFKRDWWVNNGGYQGFHTNGDVSAGLTGYGGTAFEYTNSGPYVWEKFEFSVESGNNQLEWRYRKDSSTFAGMDAVFIDNIFLPEPMVVEPPVKIKPTLVVMGINSKGFQLSISGDASL